MSDRASRASERLTWAVDCLDVQPGSARHCTTRTTATLASTRSSASTSRRILRGNPARELALIRRHLSDDGLLFVLFQPPNEGDERPAIERLRATFDAHDFAVIEQRVDPQAGASGVCLVAAAR